MELLGSEYPLPSTGPHAYHRATVVAVATHGEARWDVPLIAPVLTVECSCGVMWRTRLDEAIAS